MWIDTLARLMVAGSVWLLLLAAGLAATSRIVARPLDEATETTPAVAPVGDPLRRPLPPAMQERMREPDPRAPRRPPRAIDLLDQVCEGKEA